MALLKNNDPELFLFYSKNYPQIKDLKDKVNALQKSSFPEKILWDRLLKFSWQNFHVWNFLAARRRRIPKIPGTAGRPDHGCSTSSLLKKFSATLGQSTFCSKCAKIIKKMSIEQAHALCEDCYQLFLIKDPIFLEAKILKENDIVRQFRLKNSLPACWFPLFIPGFFLNFKEQKPGLRFPVPALFQRFRLLPVHCLDL